MNDEGGGASRTTDPASGTSAATDVSLREYFESKIWADRRLGEFRDVVERRVRIEMVAALALFGIFAWQQVQRRLEILNHENARLLTQQERTVSQDTYSANEQQRHAEQIEFKDWQKGVDRQLTQSISREEFTTDAKVDRRGTWGTGTAVASVVVAVIVVGLAILNYQALHTDPVVVPPVVTVTTATP